MSNLNEMSALIRTKVISSAFGLTTAWLLLISVLCVPVDAVIARTEDQQSWNALFDQPKPKLQTTNNHRLLEPIGPQAIYFR